VRLARRKAKMHPQTDGVHNRLNLARQPASRAIHIFLSVAGDAGSVPLYAHNGRVDHLHGRIIRGGQRFHDPVPDTCAPPPNETIVASRMWAAALRLVAPWRP